MGTDKYFIGWGLFVKMSKDLSVGDVHQALKSRLENQSSGVSNALLELAAQYWTIPATELNKPTAGYYAMDLFDKLPFSLGDLFEQIPETFQFWDLRASEKLENALIGDIQNLRSFGQIALESPAWLQSRSGLSKKPRIELLTLLILRNCHIGIRALASDVTISTEDFLAPRERVVHPYLQAEFEIFPEDEIVSWPDYWASKSTTTGGRRSAMNAEARGDEDVLKSLEDTSGIQNAILSRRILSEKPDSLGAIGATFSLSRERIRQIEVTIRAALERWISDTPELERYRADVLARASRVNAIDFAEMKSDLPSKRIGTWSAFEVVLRTADGLHQFGSYLSTKSANELRLLARELTTSRTGKFGRSEFAKEAAASGLDPHSLLNLLEQEKLIVEIEGELFYQNETLKERAIEALSRRGLPIGIDVIFMFSPPNKSLGSLKNLLFTDPAFTRTAKTKVGLTSWNLDSYSTIPEEIAKAIEHRPMIAIDDLTDDLVTRLEVSASSVRAYASTWPFEIINGKVVRSMSVEIQSSKESSEEKNLWKLRDCLVWATRIIPDHVRGSGSAIPKTLCRELGLANDKDAEFITPSGQFVRVGLMGLGWAIGSIRKLVELRSLHPGDWCFYVFRGRHFDILKTSENEVERFKDLLSTFSPELNTSDLIEFEIELKSMLFLPNAFSMPSVFSALKSRESRQLSEYIKQIFPQSLANEISDNHSKSSRFVIKSVE